MDDGASCHVNGIAPSTIDEAQLRAQIRSYTGSPIEVAYAEIPVKAVVSTLIGLLFVPKRAVDAQPCVFQKNAAVAPNGKQAFKEGQLFLRSGDESRPMQGKDDLAILLSARMMPQSILDDARTSSSLSWEPPLENNMLDKNVICPQFVGREEILNDLWGWLADPFSNVRVLAGEGGKGVTSIGYAFAIEFATRRPGNFSQVLW